jgi:hypothetical protein
MSFGISIGDFIAVSRLALDLYVAYRDGPAEVKEVSRQLMSLHATLEELSQNLQDPDSFVFGASKKAKHKLNRLISGCEGTLKELEDMYGKCRRLAEMKSISWSRLKLTKEVKAMDGLRASLERHIQGVMLFLTSVNTYVVCQASRQSFASVKDPTRTNANVH